MARLMTASPRWPSPSLAPSGTVRASLASGIKSDAARQKSLEQWSHRTTPTHATKAGVRYRYYVSTPFLHGEAKTAAARSVSRVPAADTQVLDPAIAKEAGPAMSARLANFDQKRSS